MNLDSLRVLCGECFAKTPGEEKTCAHGALSGLVCTACGRKREASDPAWHCLGHRTHPERKCNGGRTGKWCGLDATVVCTGTRREDGPEDLAKLFPGVDLSQLEALQWFACDDAAHQTDATTTPIGEWFARNVPG